jgi:hypothetical protein
VVTGGLDVVDGGRVVVGLVGGIEVVVGMGGKTVVMTGGSTVPPLLRLSMNTSPVVSLAT